MQLAMTIEGTDFPTTVTVKPATSTGLEELIHFDFRGPTRTIDVPDHWLGHRADRRTLRVGLADDSIEEVGIPPTGSWAAVTYAPELDGDDAPTSSWSVTAREDQNVEQVSLPPSPIPIVIGPQPTDVLGAPSVFASRPPHVPVFNQFSTSQEYAFFETNDRNALAAGIPVRGTMHQYSVGRHPLGFALGDWLRTTAIEPGATVASASTSLADDSGISQRQRRQSDESLSSASHRFNAVDRTDTATLESRAKETRFSFDTESSFFQPFGPLAKIFDQFSPAMTIGFSAGQSNAWGRTASGVSQVLTQEFERAARSRVAGDATSDMHLTQTTGQQHEISTYRNHDISHVRNIAVFRVNQQFMTRTKKTGQRAVVLVPVPHIDTRFETDEDIVTNAAVIGTVLLDPKLEPVLDMLTSPAGSEASVLASAKESNLSTGPFKITYDVVNAGDELHFTLQGLTASRHRFWEVSASARKASKQTVMIGNDVPFVPVSLSVRASGHHLIQRSKNKAKIENLALDDLLKSQASFSLKSGEESIFAIDSGLPKDYAQMVARRSRSLARLQTHLNDHLAYYRLAIELLDDPHTRWSRLQEISLSLRPVEPAPLGIVGNRVAYALVEPDADIDNRKEEDADSLVTIPTLATYSVAMPEGLPYKLDPVGAGEGDKTYVDLPKTTNGDFPWPKLQYRPVPKDLTNLLEGIAARLDDVIPAEPKGVEKPEPPDVTTPQAPDASEEEQPDGQGESEETKSEGS